MQFVLKYIIFLVVIIAGISFIGSANAVLWDLIIYAQVENTPLYPNENPVISGTVEDHAGKPVVNAQLQIRVSGQTIETSTDETGKFRTEIKNLQLVPGMYLINIKAVSEQNKTGMSTLEFQVHGKADISSHIGQLLQTPHAARYLNAEPKDFEKDPLGMSLYNYYQKLYQKFLQQQLLQKEIEKTDNIIAVKREIAQNITKQIIEEKNPGAGIYSGFKRDVFVDNLDSSVRDLIENQLNYTLNVFEQARQAMREVLDNGGTIKEAREAYFKKAAISQDMMNMLTQNTTLSNTTSSLPAYQNVTNSTTNEIPKEVYLNINGTNINVGTSGTSIYININGTLVEFQVNGTNIIPVTNSSR